MVYVELSSCTWSPVVSVNLHCSYWCQPYLLVLSQTTDFPFQVIWSHDVLPHLLVLGHAIDFPFQVIWSRYVLPHLLVLGHVIDFPFQVIWSHYVLKMKTGYFKINFDQFRSLNENDLWHSQVTLGTDTQKANDTVTVTKFVSRFIKIIIVRIKVCKVALLVEGR